MDLKLVIKARTVLLRAQNDLGIDLAGWSPVDLLMDNIKAICTPRDAHNLLDLFVEGRAAISHYAIVRARDAVRP